MADDRIESEQISGFGVSEDGQFAKIELSTKEEGGKVYLTMPVANLPGFHHSLGRLIDQLRAEKKLAPPDTGATAPGKWMVGQSNDPKLKGFTAVVFDNGTVNEKLYIFGDVDALAIADAIEKNVYKKLSPKEKATIDAARKKNQVPRIILPGVTH